MRSAFGRVLALAFGLLWSVSALAQSSGFKGELDVQGSHADNSADSVDAALGQRRHTDQDAWLRLMWSGSLDSGWSVDAAWLGEVRHGGGVELNRAERAFAPQWSVDPDRTAWWRLSHVVTDRGQRWAAQRLDRLTLSYSGAHLVFRLGRQALTWGGGLVFHPMDLFNPFAPDATYTAYKPGSDMVYGQWLFNSGADLQAVWVPRRDPATGQVTGTQSSGGVKWHGFAGAHQQIGIDVMLAQDYRAQVLGVAFSGPLGGATWTAEWVPTRLRGGGTRTSALLNAQYAWSWSGRNVNGFVELFRNGFGMRGTADRALTSLPTALGERLARGELFTVSRDYLALGVDLQWTPLLTLKPSVINNLDDGSHLLLGQLVYSLGQNTNLTAGLQWPIGRRGSEYGGVRSAVGVPVYLVPARRVYARVTWYF